jgi:hypothetical protein
MHDRTDGPVLRRIEELVSQEHRLHGQESLSDEDLAHLREVRMELDRSWDLLRQRRALRGVGQDPDKAQLRPPETVKKYVQ